MQDDEKSRQILPFILLDLCVATSFYYFNTSSFMVHFQVIRIFIQAFFLLNEIPLDMLYEIKILVCIISGENLAKQPICQAFEYYTQPFKKVRKRREFYELSQDDNIPHCSKSSFFVQKFNFDFPTKLSIFFGEKLVKMLWFWTFQLLTTSISLDFFFF